MGQSYDFCLRMELNMSKLCQMYAVYSKWMSQPWAAVTFIVVFVAIAAILMLML